jgi:hypothetical protein
LNVGESTTVDVNAKPKWNDAAITLRKGERYSFAASGIWNDASIQCGPEGYENSSPLFRIVERFRRAPKARWFELIGSIGRSGSDVFAIGRGGGLNVTDNGRLYFFANDLPLMYYNNSGYVQVRVTRIA